MLNLIVAFWLIRLFYKKEFRNSPLNHTAETIVDYPLARISRISFILLFTLIIGKIVQVVFHLPLNFSLVHIALLSATPILLLSKRRVEMIKKVDWHTLIFFAAMFVLMQSVWNTGIFQSILHTMNVDIVSIPTIMIVSILLSQLISNVPLVALYLPMLSIVGVSTRELMTLAAGSTIAGNMFILGAASNVIIIQNAEKRSDTTLTFFEFSRIGIPLTILNVIVYLIFFILF